MASQTTIRRSNFTMGRVIPIAILSLLFCASCMAQSQVTSITVKSSWGGLGEPSSSELVIKQKKLHYYADSNRVSDQAIQKLMTAIETPPKKGSELKGFGLDKQWLRNNAAAALRDYLQNWQYKAMSSAQQDLFINSFSNAELASAALSEQHGWVTLDDYPEISIEFVKTDGDQSSFKSVSNPHFLHHWSVTSPTGNYVTSDVAISLALGGILPKNFTNRERLSEHALRYMIAEAVMYAVRDKWDALGAEAQLGPAIRPVTDRFTLIKSAIALRLSIDLEGGEAWAADVHESTLPPNVEISFSLPIRKKELIGVNSFLKQIDSIERLTLSPDWMRQFLAAHPDAKLSIRFVENRSLSPKAERTIVADLNA